MQSHFIVAACASLIAASYAVAGPYSADPARSLGLTQAPRIVEAADRPGVSVGNLTIENAFTRPTLGGATVAVGYATIVNNGKMADRLLSVASDISSTAEIHESKMANGVMEMHEVSGGLPIAAGATVLLRPGSYHIMFLGIKHPVKSGDTIHATFTFSKAGKADVAFPAASSPGATAPDMGDMKGMKMP